jgi:hypothetical protein
MVPETLVVVALPRDLAAALGDIGAERILVVGVELHGGAILRGFARSWTDVLGGVEAAAWHDVPETLRPELERLFAEALPATEEPAGRKPRPAGKVAAPRGMTIDKSRRLARAQ